MILFSDINQSSPSNGTPIAAECSESEPQMDGSQACTCGKGTSGCSIHPNTRDEWKLCMQASLVRTLAELGIRPVSAKAREADFIGKCSELLTSFDRDTCIWRTFQPSLLTNSLEPFSETWPRAGMMQGGRVYRHRQPVPRTTVIGGGALQNVPMPNACTAANDVALKKSGDGRTKPNKLGWWVAMCPTPTVNGNYNRKGASQNSGDGLATWVKMWPTPQTRGFTNDGDLAALAKRCDSYEEMAGMAYRASDKKKRSFWPTPCSSASKGSSPPALTRKSVRSLENDRLDHAVFAVDGGMLNPAWVCWLMGWPLMWFNGVKK